MVSGPDMGKRTEAAVARRSRVVWDEMQHSEKSGLNPGGTGTPGMSHNYGIAVIAFMCLKELFRMYQSITRVSRGLVRAQGSG